QVQHLATTARFGLTVSQVACDSHALMAVVDHSSRSASFLATAGKSLTATTPSDRKMASVSPPSFQASQHGPAPRPARVYRTSDRITMDRCGVDYESTNVFGTSAPTTKLKVATWHNETGDPGGRQVRYQSGGCGVPVPLAVSINATGSPSTPYS